MDHPSFFTWFYVIPILIVAAVAWLAHLFYSMYLRKLSERYSSSSGDRQLKTPQSHLGENNK